MHLEEYMSYEYIYGSKVKGHGLLMASCLYRVAGKYWITEAGNIAIYTYGTYKFISNEMHIW